MALEHELVDHRVERGRGVGEGLYLLVERGDPGKQRLLLLLELARRRAARDRLRRRLLAHLLLELLRKRLALAPELLFARLARGAERAPAGEVEIVEHVLDAAHTPFAQRHVAGVGVALVGAWCPNPVPHLVRPELDGLELEERVVLARHADGVGRVHLREQQGGQQRRRGHDGGGEGGEGEGCGGEHGRGGHGGCDVHGGRGAAVQLVVRAAMWAARAARVARAAVRAAVRAVERAVAAAAGTCRRSHSL